VPTDATGLLVIRAWREPDTDAPLRVEIRLTRDISEGFERRITVADARAVSDIVREWLAFFGP